MRSRNDDARGRMSISLVDSRSISGSVVLAVELEEQKLY